MRLHDQTFLNFYRDAQSGSLDLLYEKIFDWLTLLFQCDAIASITSFRDRPTYQDAHFRGYPDIAEVLESWKNVHHLDEISPRLLINPDKAQFQNYDSPELEDVRFAPLREHLNRFSIRYTLALAHASVQGDSMTVFLMTRRYAGERYSEAERDEFETIAPHLAEAISICRQFRLILHPDGEFGRLAVAIADQNGWITESTTAFNRLFQNPGNEPIQAQLPSSSLISFTNGMPWAMPDGKNIMEGVNTEGVWWLRIRPASPLDCLPARERTVMENYIQGKSRKEIGKMLGIAPSTVKNHLSKAFSRLGVGNRAELLSRLETHITTLEVGTTGESITR